MTIEIKAITNKELKTVTLTSTEILEIGKRINLYPNHPTFEKDILRFLIQHFIKHDYCKPFYWPRLFEPYIAYYVEIK